VNDVLYFIEQIGGEIIQQDYNENVVLTLAIPEQKIELFQQQLQTLSAGQLLLKSITKKQ
jgi:putative IMPACT (imprinted ancient) family translation regulator